MTRFDSIPDILCQPPYQADLLDAGVPGVKWMKLPLSHCFEHSDQLMYVICISSAYTERNPNDSAGGLHHLAQRMGEKKVVLVVSESRKWRPEDGAAGWITVDQEQFVSAIARPPAGEFCDLLKDRVPPRLLNPYQSDRPVVASMFHGRRPALSDLRDTSHSFAVFGARRIGKTSLSQRVHRELAAHDTFRHATGGPRSDPWTSIAYMDMQQLASIDDLWVAILKKMGFAPSDLRVGAKFRASLKEKGQAVPIDELEILRRILKRSKYNLFLLDEVDRAIDLDAENHYRVFAHLQSLRDDEACNLRVVLFGYERLLHAYHTHDFPLNRTRLKPINLGPLTAAEVGELIEKPMQRIGVQIENIAASRHSVRLATGGMPNLVQDLCDRLLDFDSVNQTRRVTEIDIQNVIQDPKFLDRIDSQFKQIEKSLPRLVAYLMSDRDQFTLAKVLDEISKHRLGVNDRQIEDALEQLKLYSILAEAGQNVYVFASEVLQSQVRKKKSDTILGLLKQSIVAQLRGRN